MLSLKGKHGTYQPRTILAVPRVRPATPRKLVSKNSTDDAVNFISNVMAPEAHGHAFCSELMFYH